MTVPASLLQLSLQSLIERWPQTIAVLQRYRTACVGCPVAPFCTLVDTAREYQIPLQELLAEIVRVIPAAELAALSDRENQRRNEDV